MAKLWKIMRRQNASRKNDRRFLTDRDMAEIKHQEAIYNAKIKRGEIKVEGENHYISLCGCGREGCTLHGNYKNREDDYLTDLAKRKYGKDL